MENRHYKTLELDKILLMCSDFCVAQEAKEQILKTRPAKEFSQAEHQLTLTDTANTLTVRFGNPGFYQIKPCDQAIKRARAYAALSTTELLDIGKILKSGKSLKVWYKQSSKGERTPLDSLFESITPNTQLEKDIERCIIGENEIADNASTELSNLRRKIRNANQRARDALDKIVRSSKYEKYLQEQIVTIRNGRFVVPVRSEYRNEIKGLIHDTSATGSTLFIEPMVVVELNNQIKEYEIAQQREIDRILLELSGLVASDADNILSVYSALIQLDIIFAKAKLGDFMEGVTPNLVNDGETNLGQARHPLISKDTIVPIDIMVGGEFDTLVITGPNTGGKTVALKTIGLLTLMAMCGMMIPASSRSRVRFYSNILADIGDEQSIEQSLSTFSGHMTNIVQILRDADSDSLVLIDELGAGTDPIEGAALAVAIISKLRESGCHIVATTHYAEMKIYALQTPGVENASCEFDVATLRPTYKLLVGTPGRSNAFAISQRLGMPSDIILAAEEQISTENRRFEDVVSSLEETRQQLETEKLQARNLRQQAAAEKEEASGKSRKIKEEEDKIIQNAQREARSILERARFQSDRILDELEVLKKEKEKASFARSFSQGQKRIKGLIDDMEDMANPVIDKNQDYTLPRDLIVGDTVYLVDFNTEGTVTSLPDNKGSITAKAGMLDLKVPVDTVRLVEKTKQDKIRVNGKPMGSATAQTTKAPPSGSGKLDIRGLDSQEAMLELDRFIDRSVVQRLQTITIVHGKGTGVLREAVSQNLRTNKYIANYRLGGFGEGGDGATIAELK